MLRTFKNPWAYLHAEALRNTTLGRFMTDENCMAGWMVCLALLPDGRRFVCGSSDETAIVFEHGLAL